MEKTWENLLCKLPSPHTNAAITVMMLYKPTHSFQSNLARVPKSAFLNTGNTTVGASFKN